MAGNIKLFRTLMRMDKWIFYFQEISHYKRFVTDIRRHKQKMGEKMCTQRN